MVLDLWVEGIIAFMLLGVEADIVINPDLEVAETAVFMVGLATLL